MIELVDEKMNNGPRIMVIGVGGGGNNAVGRMIDSGINGVEFAVVNTDQQVLRNSKAKKIVQIGKKVTDGYGAGADPGIGEAAAIESEEELNDLVSGNDLVIITAGMGGGTGTGAAPVMARICKDNGILTVGVVTTPFTFESTPRVNAAIAGVNKLREYVDTLLVIPNDKLLTLSERALEVEDAFLMADSVLKYTIEGITNIVYNRGVVNLDFNDLRATLKDKGMGHLGIGTVDAGDSVMEAVKIAVNSPLLDTSIQGATNLLVNSSGKVNIVALNEAIGYIREMAGENVNIIWGNVKADDFDNEKIVVTIIATGMPEQTAKKAVVPFTKKTLKVENVYPVRQTADSQSELSMRYAETGRPETVFVRPTVESVEIKIPEFLRDFRK